MIHRKVKASKFCQEKRTNKNKTLVRDVINCLEELIWGMLFFNFFFDTWGVMNYTIIIRLWQSSASQSLFKKLIITTINVVPLWLFSFGLQICHTSLTLSAWSIKIRAWSPIRLVGRLVPREISRKKKQDIHPSFTTLMRLCISSSTAKTTKQKQHLLLKKTLFFLETSLPKQRENERDMQIHKKISPSSQLVSGFHFGASFTNQLCCPRYYRESTEVTLRLQVSVLGGFVLSV